MSVDIKQIVEAIKQAEANPEELDKVIKENQQLLDGLSKDSEEFKKIEEKGIFKQLKEAQDKLADIEKKAKDKEEADAKAKGQYKELSEKQKADIEALQKELDEKKGIADKWTNYEKARRESLLAKLEDPKVKAIGEKLMLEDLEQFVELHTEQKPGTGSGNHGQDKKDSDKQPYVVKYKTN